MIFLFNLLKNVCRINQCIDNLNIDNTNSSKCFLKKNIAFETLLITSDIAELLAELRSHVRAGVGLTVGLSGEMGAGKTWLVKEFVAELEPSSNLLVSSPTFTYSNIYDLKALTIVHFDLYRVDTADELVKIGFWDKVDSSQLTFIEWIDKFVELDVECDLIIKIKLKENHKRLYFLRKIKK